MSVYFFNNEDGGLKRVKMKRVKLPEEDIEKSGKGCHHRRETGSETELGLAPITPTPACLPCQASSGGSEQGMGGESRKNLACGLDINVTEGELGGGRLLKFCSPEKYISLK